MKPGDNFECELYIKHVKIKNYEVSKYVDISQSRGYVMLDMLFFY